MDYEREYDTNKVDTPGNRRGLARLMDKYGMTVDGEKPVYTDPEGEDDPSISAYLRVLADYSGSDTTKPEGLEAALGAFYETKHHKYMASVFNRLRYTELIYLSPDPARNAWPATCRIRVNGESVEALPLFTRKKQIRKEYLSGMHYHHAMIYELLDVCEEDGINNILINPDNGNMSFRPGNIRDVLNKFNQIDEFWDSIRENGVEGDDLFPLLVQDFLYRNVCCVYRNGREDQGRCIPYSGEKLPVIFLQTASGRMVRIPLDEIQFIQELPDDEEEE